MSEIIFHLQNEATEEWQKLLVKHRQNLSRFPIRATSLAAESLWEAGFERVQEVSFEDLAVSEALLPSAVFFLSNPPLPDMLDVWITENIPIALNLASAEMLALMLTERRTATLVFNPVAGSGDSKADLAAILAELEPALKLTIKETSKEISAADLAREAIAAGEKLVISAGGDGTVTEVADALIGTNVTLGIIPRGTANALAVSIFGDGLRMNPIGISCAAIVRGFTRTIDTAECNGKPMLLLAGVGLEAGMVERAERELKSKLGVLAYLIGGWEQINTQDEFDVEIICDDQTQKLRTGSIVVANAAPSSSIFAQGGGQPILDDGFLDITILLDISTPWEAMTTALSLLNAGLTQSAAGDRVLHMRAKQVRIVTNPPQKLVVDGEIGDSTPVDFQIKPRSLRVIAPMESLG